MASVMKIKDNNGNIVDIPAFVGPKGKDGSIITEVTASVDGTVGTPTVEVTLGGTEGERTIDLAFSGLKGEKGNGVPEATADAAGLVVKVQEDGTYGLGEAGLSEVSADIVTAGTFAGQTIANSEATANISVAQVRNIYGGTEDLTAGTSPLATGEVYICYE